MTDSEALRQCLRQIEARLGWGDASRWSTGDFQRLSEQIFDATGISLSVNTLKRLWGRIAYQNSPNPTTLDALAGYLGYTNWRVFRTMLTGSADLPEPIAEPGPSLLPVDAVPPKTRFARSISPGFIWSAGLLMGIAIAFGLAFSLRSTKSRPAPVYTFSSRIVAEGLPNSVIFTYDAAQSGSDCVYVQQSWDPRRRFAVDPKGHQVTSIYYYPGFFRAKLVVDGKVVKEHPLLIKTQGWLPLIEQEPVPVYFRPEQVGQKGKFGLTTAQIESANVKLQPQTPWVSYFRVGEWTRLSGSDFILETRFRNEYATGSGACQHAELGILLEGDAIILPFSRPGCVSALNLYAVGQSRAGARQDLSAFGCDFGDWVNVRCEVRSNVMRVFVDDKPAYELAFRGRAGAVVGLRYRFQGTGAIQFVRLTSTNGKVVFEDDFSRIN